MNIKFYRSDVGQAEKDAIAKVIDSGWLTQGDQVAELEAQWSKLSGYKYCIAVNSATSGLFLAHKVASTTRAYVPTYTFAATVNVLESLGIDYDLIDSCVDNFNCQLPYMEGDSVTWCPVAISGNLDFSQVSIGDSGVGYYKIILDAAHCWPDSKIDTDRVNITVWSLYANKNVPCGDGGMIGTNSKEYADKIKLLRNHGIDNQAIDRFNSKDLKVFYDVKLPGYKLNMTNLHASIALEQLKKMDENKAKRKRLFGAYDFYLPSELTRPLYGKDEDANHLYMCLCENKYTRDTLLEYLHDKGICCSVHYKPVHRMSYYKDKYGLIDEIYPNASDFADREITLPLYPSLDLLDQEYIIDCVKDFYEMY